MVLRFEPNNDFLTHLGFVAYVNVYESTVV